MHEVALSTELARVVARAAKGRRVRQVNLRIGALRQVVPSSMEYAWGFVTAATPLEGARLHIDWIDAVIECEQGHRTVLDASSYLDLSCPRCDGPTRVVAGEEFQVVDLEVEAA
ncbi:hydrogenase maturation nickel metallochaperone HypA/HybF [Corynebacterium vitaeruminis]|uniref:hydrogenase maturation nickel metallochaperone HypA/HybF n=1 Tax=Corynebacterium vitaeruminis TaxID=38305 RepID=UPI0028AA306C|nr:hydrogenase maturation nickel metallochaperone HypA [Corynebacterium vitaeruminis]